MERQIIRLFATNIPENLSETELRHVFSIYGEVKKVELKSKENLSDPSKQTKFAFITLNINEECVSKCIQDIGKRDFQGRRICVSKARESFLERLKKERQEALITKKNVNDETCLVSHQEKDASDTDNLTICNDYVKRKQGKDCLQNVQSDESKVWPDASQQQANVELLDKAQISNLKRKEGLRRMQSIYAQKKAQIKNALSQIEKPHSKQFDFNNDSADENEMQKSKIKLFDEDEENDATSDFEKLNDLQQKSDFEPKSNADPRFVMGSQFSETNCVKSCPENKTTKAASDDELSEKQWQIGIIERVIGRKVEQRKRNLGETANILHYDPSKKEHEQFIKNASLENSLNIKNVELVKEAKHQRIENSATEVSKELYYKVSNDFTQSFREHGNEFSLLDSFGVAPLEVEVDSSIKKFEKTKTGEEPGKNRRDIVHHLLPEDKDEDTVPAKCEKQRTTPTSKMPQVAVTSEGLFIFKGDQRLSQGLSFFKLNKKTSDDYEDIRKKLRSVIHRKIARAKKKQVHGGTRTQRLRFTTDRKKTSASINQLR